VAAIATDLTQSAPTGDLMPSPRPTAVFLAAVIVGCLTPMNAVAHGISESARQRMLEGGYSQYVVLGAEHMLTGYDHLLFLFGVIFFLTNVRDVVKLVTAFTLGHSITLTAATFLGITANYYLIDAVIALSVVYKGFDNTDGFRRYLDVTAPRLVTAVFGFGLIHGFGLSTRLQQLPLGEPGGAMLGRIVAFNVGVEVGQVAALLGIMLVLGVWRRRRSFPTFSMVANHALMVAGVLLFLIQMHGYLHTSNPSEFGFDTDSHSHAHEEMQNSAPEKGTTHDNL
jgi:hypothetical protein